MYRTSFGDDVSYREEFIIEEQKSRRSGSCHVLSFTYRIYALLTAKLGPFDGRVGGVIEDGKYFITSPNQTFIPLPPLGPDRPLKLRTDCRYGDDDPIQWPQPFNENFPHYSCIPRRPSCTDESIMWWKPTRDAFVPKDSPLFPISGLGVLSQDKLAQLESCVSVLLSRVQTYLQNTPSERVPQVLIPTVQMVKHGFIRLQSLSMAFRQLEFQVRDVQRFWLETVAMVDYMEIYRPRMDNAQLSISPDPPPVADRIGLFTSDVRVVQDHFQAGLPCWFIRPATAFNDQNILKVRQPELPFELDREPHPFRHRVLAEGRAGTNEKYNAIHRYARNLMKYSDPFNIGTTVNINAVAPPSVNTPQAAESSSSLGPARMQRGNDVRDQRERRGNNVRGRKGTRGNGRGRGNKESKIIYLSFINVDTD